MTGTSFGTPFVDESVSSGIGAQMIIARDLQDPDEVTTSEPAGEDVNDCLGGPEILPRGVYNETARMHNQEAREIGHPSQIVSTVHGRSSVDEEGNLVYKQPKIYTIPDSTRSTRMRVRSKSVDSQESSRLSSPPPITSYGGSEISFPSQTPVERVVFSPSVTIYEGSLLGLPASAIPQDPFSTARASAGIIA